MAGSSSPANEENASGFISSVMFYLLCHFPRVSGSLDSVEPFVSLVGADQESAGGDPDFELAFLVGGDKSPGSVFCIKQRFQPRILLAQTKQINSFFLREVKNGAGLGLLFFQSGVTTGNSI